MIFTESMIHLKKNVTPKSTIEAINMYVTVVLPVSTNHFPTESNSRQTVMDLKRGTMAK